MLIWPQGAQRVLLKAQGLKLEEVAELWRQHCQRVQREVQRLQSGKIAKFWRQLGEASEVEIQNLQLDEVANLRRECEEGVLLNVKALEVSQIANLRGQGVEVAAVCSHPPTTDKHYPMTASEPSARPQALDRSLSYIPYCQGRARQACQRPSAAPSRP